MRKVIAIAGEKEAGKDAFAKSLIQRGFQHGSFAENLKHMCKEIFNLTDYMVNTPNGKKMRLSVPRRFTSKHFLLIRRWMGRTHSMVGLGEECKKIEDEYILRPIKETGKPKELYTPREILQFIGTDICRRLVDTYHVDVLFQKIENSPESWVITDARFENERNQLREKFGAILVRIIRPSKQGSDSHPSENSLGEESDYDYVVENNGTLEELNDKARMFYETSVKEVPETQGPIHRRESS